MTDPAAQKYRIARIVAVVAGLLGALLAIATPFLPVTQTTAQLNWPQNGVLDSVTAPLIGYVATDLSISVPCQAAAGLVGPQNTDRSVLLSTVPRQAPKAVDRGLLIERVNTNLAVVVRNTPVLVAPLSAVLSPDCERLTFTARADKVTAEFVGLTQAQGTDPTPDDPTAPLKGERSGYDFRPQIIGVFTDLSGPAPPGLTLSATIDTRYSSAPTLLKLIAMILGVALTVAALIALHVLDTADGVRHRRFLPGRWWSMSWLDGLVAAALVWWHFVGANTSDDGYILTMARVSEHAGYMANYYRWFGTPEAPFGWYYDLLALWAHVSTTSVWMRLPTLLMALACWWVISREVIPRLGDAVKHSSAAAWTAAGMFLAFWLPLNNGLRPEPIIALGILLTWCSVERAVATSRLLPVAIACIIGALTLFSGPTGIASIGALLVAIGPLRTILHRRSRRFGLLPLLAPILAAITVTAILIFRDQTFVGELQASSFKSLVGPSLSWFDEHTRYERLFMATPDGSVARRFAVLALLVALALSVAMSLRRGRIPGTAAGPGRRIIGITVISFLMMMFTPTKWTHHFGVFAGLAGSLGALAAVAVTAHVMRSRRNRTIFAAVVLFVLALSFASVNGWWYVSNFGVPWSNQFPEWHFAFATMLLGLSVLTLLLATYFNFSKSSSPDRGERPWRPTRLGRLLHSPLAIAAWLVVFFEVLSLTLGVTAQYPAWSVGRSNLQALTGQTCGLANDVLVETDPNAAMLSPVVGSGRRGVGRCDLNRLLPQRNSRRHLRGPGDRTGRRHQLRRQRRRGHGDRKRARHRGRYHRHHRRQRFAGAVAVRTGSRPGGRAGQLAFGRAAARRDALRVVPIAAENRGRRRPAAAGGVGRRPVRSGRGTGAVGHRRAGRPQRAGWRGRVRRRGRGAGLAQPAGTAVGHPARGHPDPARRHRRRPGPPALDGGDPAAHPAAAHAAGRRRIAGPGDAGLAGRPGVPVPAPVRA